MVWVRCSSQAVTVEDENYEHCFEINIFPPSVAKFSRLIIFERFLILQRKDYTAAEQI